MQIVIDIPDSNIPTKQEVVSVDLHFIDGKVCECTYPFEELKAEPCEDCVSRKAAIDACLKGLNRKEMVANIKSLPSVTPEPKMGKWSEPQKVGKWVYHPFNPEDAICSRCACSVDTTIIPNFEKYDYCPYCGSRMEVRA